MLIDVDKDGVAACGFNCFENDGAAKEGDADTGAGVEVEGFECGVKCDAAGSCWDAVADAVDEEVVGGGVGAGFEEGGDAGE